jgi:hypothetical protein
VPAKILRELSDEEIAWKVSGTRSYHELQLTAHRLNVAAQRRDVHIRTFFDLGNGGLLNVQHLGQHLLRQPTRLTQFVERHFCQHGLRLGFGPSSRFG